MRKSHERDGKKQKIEKYANLILLQLIARLHCDALQDFAPAGRLERTAQPNRSRQSQAMII
jgi:hypothetical protein